MREIVLDTETTGLDAADHRIVEIGCVELFNHVPTGEVFQRYVNPGRDMPEEAQRVHGLSSAFLSDKPNFAAIAEEFLAFVGGTRLVIHNAAFDLGFLNAELARVGRGPIPTEQAVDTVALARRKYPGAPANLDALCRRFAIDNSARTKHGALLDAELLAEVYLELLGGRQPGLVLGSTVALDRATGTAASRVVRPARPHQPTPEEAAAHAAFIETLVEPIWST